MKYPQIIFWIAVTYLLFASIGAAWHAMFLEDKPAERKKENGFKTAILLLFRFIGFLLLAAFWFIFAFGAVAVAVIFLPSAIYYLFSAQSASQALIGLGGIAIAVPFLGICKPIWLMFVEHVQIVIRVLRRLTTFK